MQVDVSVLGTAFSVGSEDGEALAEIERLFGWFQTEPQNADRTVHLGRAATADGALQYLIAHLNATALARADCLAIQAGAVARDGRVIAIPAARGAGRSTLVAASLKAGLDYVSDEALCLSWVDGSVLAYPRPLGLTSWACRLLGLTEPSTVDERYLTPGDLGAQPAAEPLEVAHVVLLDRQDGLSAAITPADPGDVEAELTTHALTHWKDPDRTTSLVHTVATTAGAWRLTLGDPRDAANLLARLLLA